VGIWTNRDNPVRRRTTFVKRTRTGFEELAHNGHGSCGRRAPRCLASSSGPIFHSHQDYVDACAIGMEQPMRVQNGLEHLIVGREANFVREVQIIKPKGKRFFQGFRGERRRYRKSGPGLRFCLAQRNTSPTSKNPE